MRQAYRAGRGRPRGPGPGPRSAAVDQSGARRRGLARWESQMKPLLVVAGMAAVMLQGCSARLATRSECFQQPFFLHQNPVMATSTVIVGLSVFLGSLPASLVLSPVTMAAESVAKGPDAAGAWILGPSWGAGYAAQAAVGVVLWPVCAWWVVPYSEAVKPHQVEPHRGGEDQRVDPIEDAAVAGDEVAPVLDPGIAFDR
jgi:hypothetical protein